MDRFETIRPYHDSEVTQVLEAIKNHELIQAMLLFGFPELTQQQREERLLACPTIFDFQSKIMYQVVKKAIEKTIQHLSTEGFSQLQPSKAYLFFSNHRDIILDTSLLNVTLHDNNLRMTTSAIGDNLVRKKILRALAMLNRNFIIHRNLSPRETLERSRIVSEYIKHSITQNERSVWIAQREGRTKNGDDRTQQGVLKMLSLACPSTTTPLQYLKSLSIVPMAVSYEFDPTDMLKMPAIMAKHYGKEYVKSQKEDFENIVQGLVGKKGRVHVSVGKPLYEELDIIEKEHTHINKQLQVLAELLDSRIHAQYRLFPSNYIAHDLLKQNNTYAEFYNEKEFRQFSRRLKNRSQYADKISKQKYLEMYATPVKNKMK